MSVLPTIEQEFIALGDVKLEVRPIAIIGEESSLAVQAARCGDDQDKFWEFQDTLYANQSGENKGTFSKANLKRFAEALGLDTTAFNSCLDSEKYTTTVQKDTAAAQGAGVKSTPTILVNGAKVEPVLDAVKAAIEAALAGGS